MRIGFYQFFPVHLAVSQNRSKIAEAVENSNVDIIVFPELALSGYSFSSYEELVSCSETREGKTALLFQRIADTTETAIITGFAEYDTATGHIFNSALCVRPHKPRRIYRKSHLFDTEKKFFTSGDTGFFTFSYKKVSIGMLVCFDHMFPEAARTLALQGVSIICHPSNLVLEGYAQLTTRVRALENHVFWILANRTGHEGSTVFTGSSHIVDPHGDILIAADRESEGLFSVEIDPLLARDKAVTEQNNILTDRRCDLYRL